MSSSYSLEIASLCLPEGERDMTAMMQTLSVSMTQPRITESFQQQRVDKSRAAPPVLVGPSASQCGNQRAGAAVGGPMRKTLCAHKAGRDTPYTRFPVLPPPPALTGQFMVGRPVARPTPVAARRAQNDGGSLESLRG